MRLLPLSALVLAWVVSIAKAQQTATAAPQLPEQNGVLVLSEGTFAVAARAFDPLFVLFDTSTRYGSLTLSRRFTDAAQAVRRYDWDVRETVRFASLDVSQLTHTLPYELKVLGLPALLLFHCLPAWPVSNELNSINVTLSSCAEMQGDVEVYTGGRTSMEFQRFARGQPLREAIRVAASEELDTVVQTSPFVALFIVDGDDSQAFIDCRVLAQVDADTSAYVVTTNERILQSQNDPVTPLPIPALVLFREFGKERLVYKGEWSKAALLQFIQKNRYNLVSTYTDRDASYFYDRAAVGHVLIFSDPSESYHAPLLQEAQDVAYSYYVAGNNPGGHVLRFLVLSKDQTTLTHALFVTDDQFPTALVVQNVSHAPSRMPFVGATTLELIRNGTIAHALSEGIEKIFPPYATADLPDGDDAEERIDWRDYSDLFVNRRVPFLLRAGTQPTGTSLAGREPQERIERRLVEMEMDTSSVDAMDDFLTLFTSPAQSLEAVLPRSRVHILNFNQLQALLTQHDRAVLVVLHSPRCYSCRQAMAALDLLPRTSAVPTVAIVNVDRVDVRDWPFQFEWLPGIFLLQGADQVAMFPSRTAVTVDALEEFIQHHGTTSQIPSHVTDDDIQ